MHVVEDWMESLKSEEARDLAEELLDLIFFGLKESEDRSEAMRLLNELQDLGEVEAVQILSKKIEK